MNEFQKIQPMKRRTFFGLATAVAAAVMSGASSLPAILRRTRPTAAPDRSVRARSNPLAVPRTVKGQNTNG